MLGVDPLHIVLGDAVNVKQVGRHWISLERRSDVLATDLHSSD